MASINRKKKTHEGAPAKFINPVNQLRRSVMSCFLWEENFYEDGEYIASRIFNLVGQVSTEVAAAIAVEARDVHYLRHVPLLICCAMIKHHSGAIVGDTIAHVIQRADELSEIYSLAQKLFPQNYKSLKQLKRGVATAFHKFDAYDFAKYKNKGKDFTLRDAMFLSHPIPNPDEAELFKKIANNTLEVPDTWETSLSSGEDKQGTWMRLIGEKKLGGLALLRNLRNMQQVGVPIQVLRNAIRQHKFNRVLPFRFVAAAKYAPDLKPELEEAMFRITESLPKLQGKTLLLIDHSASMDCALSGKSDMNRFDAACALAMILREICDGIQIFCFNEHVVKVKPRRGFALRDEIDNCTDFGMTYLGNAVHQMSSINAERLIVITDEQSYDKVPDPVHPKSYMINVDCNKNGVGYYKWLHIDGFSENIIKFISEVENV